METPQNPLSNNPEICPNCYVGIISRQTKSLVVMHGEKPVVFPYFPSWACDVCNAFVYDPAALAHLQVLISSNNRSEMAILERKARVKRPKLNKVRKHKTIDSK